MKKTQEFTEVDFAIKAEIEKYLKATIKDSFLAREAIGSWKETLESEDVLLILKKLNNAVNNNIKILT